MSGIQDSEWAHEHPEYPDPPEERWDDATDEVPAWLDESEPDAWAEFGFSPNYENQGC